LKKQVHVFCNILQNLDYLINIKSIWTMDKLLKISTVNGKILILHKKNSRKGIDKACFANKRKWFDENGCVPWMKRVGLYTSGVVGRETIHMGYIKQKLCSSEVSKKTSTCLKQNLYVWKNMYMLETTSTCTMVK